MTRTAPVAPAEKPSPVMKMWPPAPQSVGRARRFLAAHLDAWGLSQLADTAELILSELITNAVTHAYPPYGQLIATRFERLASGVRIEVHDAAGNKPERRTVLSEEESGRGLALVDALTDGRWGVSDREGPGKVVWAVCAFASVVDGARAVRGRVGVDAPCGRPQAEEQQKAGQRESCAGAGGQERPVRVPFIARWGQERPPAVPVILRPDGRGIGYAGERSYDREGGVLWTRIPSQPGCGKVELGKVHGLRQRLAMSGLWCQVCGDTADRSAEGVLWLIDADRRELLADGELTAHPPVCEPCARWSVRVCPHLRPAWTTVRVRRPTLWGVYGALYRPARPGPVAVDAGMYAFGDPRLPWVRASQLVTGLHDVTVVVSHRGPAVREAPV